MRSKIIQLALAFILITGIAVVGCGGECRSAEFQLSNLVIAPSSPYVNEDILVSIDVTNTGGVSGNYTAILVVNSNTSETKQITLQPAEKRTVTFSYAATAAGLYYINIGSLNGALQVQDVPTGYWLTNYRITGGKIVLLYSIFGATPEVREIALTEDQGTMTLLVNESTANGKRDIIVPEDAWYLKQIFVEKCVTNVNMTIDVSLTTDGSGWLYTRDGIGDVDVTSESVSGREPVQVNTIGDGATAPAGSMILDLPLLGYARTTAGQKVDLSLDLIFTTGHISNIVTRPGKGIDGSEMESSGMPFERDGGPSPYIGTAGTLATTGTGDCLNLRLAGFETDFQAEIQLKLVPK